MKTDIEKWLDDCPLPVVGRVIDNNNDLRYLGYSAHIYETGMLVVIDIRALNKEKDNGST